MKQRKYGKKVYNWHRPLGPSQLRRRFLRSREQSTSVEENLASFEEWEDDFYDPWSYTPGWDCCEACFNAERGFAEGAEIGDYSLRLLLEELLSPNFWKLDLESVGEKIVGKEDPGMGLSADGDLSLEERLWKHMELVKRYPENSETLKSALLAGLNDQKGLKLISEVSQRVANANLVKLICLFAPFWKREPVTWDGEGGEVGLLRHLFARYDVPWFLYPSWMQVSEFHSSQLKWLNWFILIGQGGSLKKAATFFDWKITGKHQGLLNKAPADTDCVGACLFAEVKRLGGTRRVFDLLMRDNFFIWDPTDPKDEHLSDEGYESFWRETVVWLSKHEATLSDEDSEGALSWAAHEYTESLRQGRGSFSWKGRSVGGALERARGYLQGLLRPWLDKNWSGHGLNWERKVEGVGVWAITELTTGEELYEEGKRMRHCVSGYVSQCVSGYAAIFSLRLNDSRRITIQINPASKKVVQARGVCNRAANSDERAILALWSREHLA